MNWKDQYKKWCEYPKLENDLKKILKKKAGNEAWLEDCFYKNLEFGTGGMRGELGPGPNRMNCYTIRRASEGLSHYIKAKGKEAIERGVVIAYDSRHQSKQFAFEAARTLGKNRIKSYVFNELRPTPELSYAVRHLQAYAGIVITASHNPSEYNGFKVYGPDGGQLTDSPAEELIGYVNGIEDELSIEVADEQQLLSEQLLQILSKDIDEFYYEKLQEIVVQPDLIKKFGRKVKIVFSPLHGASITPVRRALADCGFDQVTIVAEQEKPDPNFSTVKSPNPEEHEAFALAIDYGQKENADVLLATDPDGDRMGVAVKNDVGDYVVLTGNQTGALMLDYILTHKKKDQTLPENGLMIKTIVTSELGRAIADHFSVRTFDTLTGFKYIAEKIGEFDQTKAHSFLFGYEESYGYLIGDFVRDKDAVQACILASELAAYYKSRQMTLYDGLMELYGKYGYYQEGLESLTLKGKAGVEKIKSILSTLRKSPAILDSLNVTVIEDYQSGELVHLATGEYTSIHLPKSNVLKYKLKDGAWLCIRPSGTEPKIKLYFGVRGDSLVQSKERLKQLKEAVMEKIDGMI
ncbi:phospho-sugar mutase [bacterium LRH843]|nr:phospho-sugar mutase [bacterium LRH843]